MTFCSANITTHGKWILAGEHAVIRNNDAIVFPLMQKTLFLKYIPYTGKAVFGSAILENVFEYATKILQLPFSFINGTFSLSSNIPIQAGLGGSAAISVAVAQWFYIQNIIQAADIFDFARSLENLFHGKSSGVDIAGAQAHSAVYYRHTNPTPLHMTWQPQWYLSYSGQSGSTTECITNVLALWEKNTSFASKIDEQMQQAVIDCKNALTGTHIINRLSLLQQGIEKALLCFEQWNLISECLLQHMTLLKKNGALAVKPTGSGLGGYVLSLWETPPPPITDFIPITN